MPHLPVIIDLIEQLNQMNVYSHDIGEKIQNNEFHGQNLTNAEDAQTAVEGLVNEIHDRFGDEIQQKIAQQQSVLGI